MCCSVCRGHCEYTLRRIGTETYIVHAPSESDCRRDEEDQVHHLYVHLRAFVGWQLVEDCQILGVL